MILSELLETLYVRGGVPNTSGSNPANAAVRSLQQQSARFDAAFDAIESDKEKFDFLYTSWKTGKSKCQMYITARDPMILDRGEPTKQHILVNSQAESYNAGTGEMLVLNHKIGSPTRKDTTVSKIDTNTLEYVGKKRNGLKLQYIYYFVASPLERVRVQQNADFKAANPAGRKTSTRY